MFSLDFMIIPEDVDGGVRIEIIKSAARGGVLAFLHAEHVQEQKQRK